MLPIAEGTVTFETLLVILSTVFAYMLIMFLWIGKSKDNRGNIFLSLLILQFSLYVLPEFTIALGIMEDFPHVVRCYSVGSMLLGPFIYFYVRTCIEESFKVTWKMGWHFIPAILVFISEIPFITLPGAEKIPYAYGFYYEGSFHQPQIVTIAKAVSVCVYAFFTIRYILKYRSHLNDATSSIDAAFHRWLLFFCLSTTIPFVSSILYLFASSGFIYSFLLVTIFLVIIIAFSLLIVKPSIFHRFPHQIEELTESTTQKDKYESSKLQEEQKEAYIQKLMAFFELKKPFQSPELTLKELAEQVKIPAHYLSQVINEKLDSNFIDFINSYRVKVAQEMLIDPKLSHFTIVSIAYDAGFSAKSTFYAVFKKHTGMTPSAYRKQAKQVA